MTDVFAPAPRPAHRLIPSQFPPIGLFDTVATAADLPAVMELVGWTNDRLVADRIDRLPQSEWVYGVPNASIVMAAFLHVAPGGMRFNGPALGAWYAADDIRTAAAEVGHHLRRETVARSLATMTGPTGPMPQRYWATISPSEPSRPRARTFMRATVMMPRGSLARRFARRVERDCYTIACDGMTAVTSLRIGRATSQTLCRTDHFEITVLSTSRVIDVRKLSV